MDDELWPDEYGDDDLDWWRERFARMWSAHEGGVRDTRILNDLFEPDEACRRAMSLHLFTAASSGFESEVQWLFGAAAVAGVVPPIPGVATTPEEMADLGRIFIHSAADESFGEGWPWDPAVAYLAQHPDEG